MWIVFLNHKRHCFSSPTHAILTIFLLSFIFPPKDRPASQAGPRDDDDEDDITSDIDGEEEHGDGASLEEALVVKVCMRQLD